MTVGLRDGQTLDLEFGGVADSGLPYALTVLDQEPWIFEFPPLLYYNFVRKYLAIPANVP